MGNIGGAGSRSPCNAYSACSPSYWFLSNAFCFTEYFAGKTVLKTRAPANLHAPAQTGGAAVANVANVCSEVAWGISGPSTVHGHVIWPLPYSASSFESYCVEPVWALGCF